MVHNFQERIVRAKMLIATSRHISMATVNEDGSPHNSPVRFLYDSKLEYIYWGSHPDALHSKNVVRTGKVFCALYDRIERGGVYVQAEDAEALQGDTLKEALLLHNTFRVREGSDELALSYYEGKSPQRMYRARIRKLWINDTEKDVGGHLVKDVRREIAAADVVN